MKTPTQNHLYASMPAALTYEATMVIKIPSPLNGYIHPGDCIVLLSGWLLSPIYGFIAAVPVLGVILTQVFERHKIL